MVASKDLHNLSLSLSPPPPHLLLLFPLTHSTPTIPPAWDTLPPDAHIAQFFLQIREAFFAILGKIALLSALLSSLLTWLYFFFI